MLTRAGLAPLMVLADMFSDERFTFLPVVEVYRVRENSAFVLGDAPSEAS